jgi:phage tail sheath protein FI
MVALLHPGVYVREVAGGVRAIEGVPTSTTIFVGETERGPLEPVKIRSASEYARLYGGHLRHEAAETPPTRRVLTRYATDLFFQNGGTSAYVLRASYNGTSGPNTELSGRRAPGSSATTDPRVLESVSPGEWGNHVYAVMATSGTAPNIRFRVVVYYRSPGGSPAFVEDWDRLSENPADPNYAGEVLKRSSYVRWIDGAGVPITTSDTPLDVSKILELTEAELNAITLAQFTSAATNNDVTVPNDQLTTLLARLDGVDDAAIAVGASERWLGTTGTSFQDNADAIKAYYETLRGYVDGRPKQDLFLVADAPAFTSSTNGITAVRDYVVGVAGPPAVPGITTTTFAGLYWPHLEVPDPVGPTLTSTVRVPPSGAVAGLYGRTDARRGVWKAPAGVEATVNGAVRLQRNVVDGEQDDLNPAGINVIRPIPGAGTVVWGSRTLRPASEWRYVPVRRTAMFLRKSIFNGIQFAVFEPNDTQLWSTLRATVTAFMETQFRNGAFAGATSRDAYFVKVDAETTTPEDQAQGIVNILVGFAPLRPAEFVVVRLSQKTATST